MVRIDVVSAQGKKSMETRRKILDATERLLSEYDFRYLTVRNICAESEAAYGSFYHHFQSKERLLYEYGKELFHRNREQNPCPAWIPEGDYVNRILWNFLILGEFCTAMGKDYVRCVHQTGGLDLFEDTYDSVVIVILKNAYRKGYIREYEGKDVVDNMIKDIQIIYRGTIMWWCAQTEDREPLAATLEHLLLHLLSGRRSEKADTSGVGRLLTDLEYQKDIHFVGIPGSINESKQ